MSHTHGTVTFRDVFETPDLTSETNVHPCCVTMSSLLRLVISSQSVSHSSHGEQAAILVSLGLTTAHSCCAKRLVSLASETVLSHNETRRRTGVRRHKPLPHSRALSDTILPCHEPT